MHSLAKYAHSLSALSAPTPATTCQRRGGGHNQAMTIQDILPTHATGSSTPTSVMNSAEEALSLVNTTQLLQSQGSGQSTNSTTKTTSFDYVEAMDAVNTCRVCLAVDVHHPSRCPHISNWATFLRVRNANYYLLPSRGGFNGGRASRRSRCNRGRR